MLSLPSPFWARPPPHDTWISLAGVPSVKATRSDTTVEFLGLKTETRRVPIQLHHSTQEPCSAARLLLLHLFLSLTPTVYVIPGLCFFFFHSLFPHRLAFSLHTVSVYFAVHTHTHTQAHFMSSLSELKEEISHFLRPPTLPFHLSLDLLQNDSR